MQLAAGAVARIHQPQLLQLPEGPVIGILPGALGRGLPVVVKAQPAKVPAEGFGVLRAGSRFIQILHPQNHFPVPGADTEPGQQRGKHVPQVHPPGGGGGEPANGYQPSH